MSKSKKKLGLRWVVCIIFLSLSGLMLLIRLLVNDSNVALFNSKGQIAQAQQNLMVFTVSLLLVFAAPTVFFLFFTAWQYRESNKNAKHSPGPHHGKLLVPIMWLTPTVFIALLALVMWPSTHRLTPQKSIAADTKPMTIQVVALSWKWLFIYPEQNIATVNFVQVPVDTPIVFELTADKVPMSSFWVPNLGGQLYAMTGHVNKLNLIANNTGDYPGKSAEINGAGFSGMKFTTRASSAEDFDKWVQEIKRSPDILDADAYKNLLEPTENNPAAFYSSYQNNLYSNAVMKYHNPKEEDMHH